MNLPTFSFVRPEFRALERAWSSFQVCGYTGFLLALGQSILLVKQMGLSQLTLLGITATVVATFYSLAMAVKILFGEEILIYYRLEIALMAVTAIFLKLTGNPVLPYLDVVVLGIGTFLVCGRVGCLMVGCCHGRPCGWGVTYSEEHARIGFSSQLVGVRLYPIQLVESLFVLCVVIWGSILVLSGSPQGSASTFYTLIYGVGRFLFEFARGDRERPYLLGFSEAQWTSLLLAIAVACAEWARILPFSRWHWILPASMCAAVVSLLIWRRIDRLERYKLLHPHHIWEISAALDHLEHSRRQAKSDLDSSDKPSLHLAQTSAGYLFSRGATIASDHPVHHFSVSKADGSLSLGAAQTLARLIVHLVPHVGAFTILPGRAGVFHILFDAPVPRNWN